MRNIPFKHVKDVQVLAHRVFGEITPEMVRNVYEKVEEQEDWYRKLHNLERLPVEGIETVNEAPESEMVEQLEEGVLRFDEDGFLIIPSDAEIEAIQTPVIIPSFECPHCDYKSSEKYNLSNHISSVHDGKKPYKCPICESRFTLKYSLSKHKARLHN